MKHSTTRWTRLAIEPKKLTNKLADLKEQKPADFDEQKAAMLKELNAKLIKNEINKEKCRRQATFSSWREERRRRKALKKFVLSRWVDYTGE